MGEEDIAKVLSRLTEDGFLGFDGGSYRYDCDAAQRAAVDHVAQVYAKQPVSVTELIHAQRAVSASLPMPSN